MVQIQSKGVNYSFNLTVSIALSLSSLRVSITLSITGYYSHQWSEISSVSQLVDCDPITSGSGPAAAAAAAGSKPSGTLAENTKSAVIVKTGK